MKAIPPALLITLTLALSGPVNAQDFTGWCLVDDGCMGYMPIENGAYPSCESNCTLLNPTRVVGMDAYLFDVTCKGDWGSRSERMMLMTYPETNGGTAGLAVTERGPQELVRCQ